MTFEHFLKRHNSPASIQSPAPSSSPAGFHTEAAGHVAGNLVAPVARAQPVERDQASELRELALLEQIESPAPEHSPRSIAAAQATVDAIENEVTLEQIQAAWVLRDWIMSQAKAISAAFDERALAWILHNKQEPTLGAIKLYAGFPKTTKCPDQRGAVKSILEEKGGDVDAICDCMGADALKYGAVEKLAPATYAKFFKVERKARLTEGKAPGPILLVTNTEFAK